MFEDEDPRLQDSVEDLVEDFTEDLEAEHQDKPDAAITDELPADLNISGYVGPYLFPNNSRRRVPAIIYMSAAVVCVALWAVVSDSPLVNGGFLVTGIVLAVFGVYGLICGRELKIDESDALVAAVAAVGFPVGHASAQMGWRGWFSRPMWRILLYSNEPQPSQRGLVFVDGITGDVIDQLVQPNPEDWADLQAG
ncbi:MAG: MFS transporter [Acidimicrobiia bacterium]|nr:MFS transporter [Acidimicrobiia bacterium]MYC57300.1 MFS transporter [Acidimicrobiia bacterium]MYG94503.1 MFS transporter [Acidimicrobiia bacterium]